MIESVDKPSDLFTSWLSDTWVSVLGQTVGVVILAISALFFEWVRRRWQSNRTFVDRRKRLAWSSISYLRPAKTDAPLRIDAYGRVPLEPKQQDSRYSFLRVIAVLMMLRPSSPKPAFVITDCERVPATRDSSGGGFRLKIRLGHGEHAAHFRKSVEKACWGHERVLAICTPEQLTKLSAHVPCFLVEVPQRRHIGEDDEGSYVWVESADPIGETRGHEWQPRRKDVPEDAIWLVRADETHHEHAIDGSERDWASRRRKRYGLPLVALALVTVAPTVMIGLGLFMSIAWLNAIQASTAWAAPLISVVTVAFMCEVLLLGALSVFMLARHSLGYFRELRWGRQWTAGTTGCLDDAKRIRNGRPLAIGRAKGHATHC